KNPKGSPRATIATTAKPAIRRRIILRRSASICRAASEGGSGSMRGVLSTVLSTAVDNYNLVIWGPLPPEGHEPLHHLEELVGHGLAFLGIGVGDAALHV